MQWYGARPALHATLLHQTSCFLTSSTTPLSDMQAHNVVGHSSHVPVHVPHTCRHSVPQPRRRVVLCRAEGDEQKADPKSPFVSDASKKDVTDIIEGAVP